MMKKLAKATLLAAAAFLLAGFPACSSDDDDPTLDKIEIKVDESTVKTTYSVGEAFDRTGITVMATYSDGSTEDVTDKADYEATCNGEVFTTATAGVFEVTLTAFYEDEIASTTCTITVNDGTGNTGNSGNSGSGNENQGNGGNENQGNGGNENQGNGGNENQGNGGNGDAETPAAGTYTFTPDLISTVTSASTTDATVTVDGFVFTYNNVCYKTDKYATSADAESFESDPLAYLKFGGKKQPAKNYIAFTVPAGKTATVKATLFAAPAEDTNRADKYATIAEKTPTGTVVATSTEKTVMTTETFVDSNKNKYFGVPTESGFDKTLSPTVDTTYYLGYLDDTIHFTSVSVTLE